MTIAIDHRPFPAAGGSARRAPRAFVSTRIVLLFALAASAAGCGGARWRRENIFATDGLYLYREWKESEGVRVPLRYRHPVEVSAEKLTVILSRMRYRKEALFSEARDAFVFEPAQAEVGALALSEALAVIAPDERLRFLFVTRPFTALLTGIKGTSGVVFSEREGVLEIAFDRVHAGMGDSDDDEPARFSFPYEPTEFDDLSPLRLDGKGITRHVDAVSEREFPRWLEVELAAIEIPEAPAPPRAAAGPPAGGGPQTTGAPPATDESTSVEAAGVPAPGAESAAASASGAGAPPLPGSDREDAAYDRLKDSLELLERLKDDGVISAEEYAERRERLLDRALGGTETPGP